MQGLNVARSSNHLECIVEFVALCDNGTLTEGRKTNLIELSWSMALGVIHAD